MSGRPYGVLMKLLGLVAQRCKDCQRRFPLWRGTALSTVQLGGDISGRQEEAITATLREVFIGVPGSWRIKVVGSPNRDRWFVSIEGNRMVQPIRISLEATDPGPQSVSQRVEDSLEREGFV